MKRKELAVWFRRKNANDFKERLSELRLEKAKLMGDPGRKRGLLKGNPHRISIIKKEIAQLLTIANQRKLKI